MISRHSVRRANRLRCSAQPPCCSTHCISWSVTWSGVVGHPFLQNGVVWVCAERATIVGRPVRLRPDQLPGAGGRVFPEPVVLARRHRSPRWAAASCPPPPLSHPLLPVSVCVDTNPSFLDVCGFFFFFNPALLRAASCPKPVCPCLCSDL